MKPISALISAILIPLYAGAQDIKTASLILPEEPLCPAAKAAYTASATCNGQDTAAQYYIWDMDNGAVLETTEPALLYAYPEGGAYMARITAVFADGSRASGIREIRVGKRPSFAGYSSSLNPRHNGICLGESARLSLQVESMPVEYRCRNFYMEKSPQSIYNSSWLGTVNLKNLPGGGDAVSGITVTASTDNDADIRLVLQAPDGGTAIIKEYGDTFFENFNFYTKFFPAPFSYSHTSFCTRAPTRTLVLFMDILRLYIVYIILISKKSSRFNNISHRSRTPSQPPVTFVFKAILD